MRALKYASLFLMILMVGYLWVTKFSNQARLANKNVLNSKKLKIGIKIEDVILIMGKPQKMEYRQEEQDSILFYTPPFAASSGIDLIIKNGTLTQVIEYEGT